MGKYKKLEIEKSWVLLLFFLFFWLRFLKKFESSTQPSQLVGFSLIGFGGFPVPKQGELWDSNFFFLHFPLFNTSKCLICWIARSDGG